jgi:hypothetical protein
MCLEMSYEEQIKQKQQQQQQQVVASSEIDSIKQLFNLQQERALVYEKFKHDFKHYLVKKSEENELSFGDEFKIACKQFCDKLNEISLKIIEIKNQFDARKLIFKLIDSLQAQEQLKFQMVKPIYFINIPFLFKLFLNLLLFFCYKTLELYVLEQKKLDLKDAEEEEEEENSNEYEIYNKNTIIIRKKC